MRVKEARLLFEGGCDDARSKSCMVLRAGLVFLFFEEGKKTDTGNLNHLESNSGNITNGVTGTTETGH